MANALLLTDGLLHLPYAKTAHGLITGLSRYPIQGVVDFVNAGKEAGSLIDGRCRDIPIYATVKEALAQLSPKPTHCIVGVATHGGHITSSLQSCLAAAIENHLCVVNGLHELVSSHPALAPLIEKYEVEVIDIRKPKPFSVLHAWQGEIQSITLPRVTLLGMDCAVGKRTTTQKLYTACNAHQIRTEMIYTGQTGWLQGFQYGFILDSTLNDFVSGELEHAIINCVNQAHPQLILIEGQSSLRNPSGPCGAEFILSGGSKWVILQHAVGQRYFKHGDKVKYPLPSLHDEIALIGAYGAQVLAITLNTTNLENETWEEAKQRISDETGLPTFCPKEEGVKACVPLLRKLI